MKPAVICAPLPIEKAALRRALTPVVRSGMGPARSRRFSVAGAPVLVAGVGGGLAPSVRPGDVVVATTVRDASGTVVEGASVPLLAAAVRDLGVTVHIGPIVSVDRVAHGEDRRRLAETGALAVDMESFWLVPAGGEPFAVVRVITDTEDAPLFGPGSVPRGIRALRTLARLAPALDAWAAAFSGSEDLNFTQPKEVS